MLGRKNYYGSKSRDGTHIAALFFSLIENARKAGMNPCAYLTAAADAAIIAPGTTTLPWEIQ